MGAIAEATRDYAQPLLDETDGSVEQVQTALDMAMICWNLSLMPKEEQDEAMEEIRAQLKMRKREFQSFRTTVLEPMIRRHEEMFPLMHGGEPPSMLEDWSLDPVSSSPPKLAFRQRPAPPAGKYPGTGRNRPCPCGSGRKYKLCCGR